MGWKYWGRWIVGWALGNAAWGPVSAGGALVLTFIAGAISVPNVEAPWPLWILFLLGVFLILVNLIGNILMRLWPFGRRDALRSLPTSKDSDDLVQFVRGSMLPAFDLAAPLLKSAHHALMKGEQMDRKCGILLNRAIIEPAQNARIAVANRFDGNDSRMLDELAGDLYEKYQWVITWISQIGPDSGGIEWESVSVESWLNADEKFRDRLQYLIASPVHSGSPLERRVREVGWGDSTKQAIRDFHEAARREAKRSLPGSAIRFDVRAHKIIIHRDDGVEGPEIPFELTIFPLTGQWGPQQTTPVRVQVTDSEGNGVSSIPVRLILERAHFPDGNQKTVETTAHDGKVTVDVVHDEENARMVAVVNDYLSVAFDFL